MTSTQGHADAPHPGLPHDGHVHNTAPGRDGRDHNSERQPRLNPSPWHPNYLVLRALATQMASAIKRHFRVGAGISVVDIGCGDQPYEALFHTFAARYVAVDVVPRPRVDVVAPAEALPFNDSSFDCVLCTQVLEHSEDPQKVIREARRVLKPQGVAILSTHGVYRYHPNPEDYWRWTHAGLERLFRMCGQWEQVDVYPNGGEATAFAYLLSAEVYGAASKLGFAAASAPLIFFTNVAAWNLDRALKPYYRNHPPALSANYLVVGVK